MPDNLSAFDPEPSSPAFVSGLDYLLVVPEYAHKQRHPSIAGIRERLEGHAAEQRKKAESKGPAPKRFSTDAAIKWGRKQGWKLLDRERYNHKTKRHHDLLLGADASFETPEGIVLVQGAGKSERSMHWNRFQERGGKDRADRLHCRFVYVEFERGNPNPIKFEWWVS